MIVEDSAFIRKLVRSILGGIGINKILEAPDGVTALRLMNVFEPDIILLDWEMPNLNGPQLIRFVRAHGDLATVTARIIILSAHAHREKVIYAKENGIGGFVMKPISAKVLRDHIVSVLAKDCAVAQWRDANKLSGATFVE